jgi:pimeloyl-ACP methyl ester carboxylesterase
MLDSKIFSVQTERGFFQLRDSSEGFPLVFLHGWPESSHCWDELLKHLKGDFRFIRPDLRGLGDSIRTLEMEAYAKSELALDIIAILNQLNIREFGLIGHDWGGIVAQEMALAIPQRIKKMVLMNISLINNARGNLEAREALKRKGYTYNWYQTFQQQPELADAMIKGNEAVWLRHFLRMANGKKFNENTIQEYIRTFQIEGTATTSANLYRAMKIDLARWQALEGIKFKMPGMYIHGFKDIVIIPEYSMYLEDCFPESTLVKIDAGHFVQEEEPELCAKAITSFFV